MNSVLLKVTDPHWGAGLNDSISFYGACCQKENMCLVLEHAKQGKKIVTLCIFKTIYILGSLHDLLKNGISSLSLMQKISMAFQVVEALLTSSQMCLWMEKSHSTGDFRMTEMTDPDAIPIYHM